MAQDGQEVLTIRERNARSHRFAPPTPQRQTSKIKVNITSSGPDPTITYRGCFICRRSSCQLTSHRLLTLEVMHRALRDELQQNDKRNDRLLSVIMRRGSTGQALTYRPRTPSGSVYSFLPLPLEGATERTVQLFHDFFSRQGRSLLHFQAQLSFDKACFPQLFQQALLNPALCMSLVAMAATFNGIHGQNLTAPDRQILDVHVQAFEELRKQLATEEAEGVSEISILAAINLCMCCGISFCDAESAQVHWQGVLALMGTPYSRLYFGQVLTCVNNLDHWLVLIAGNTPLDDKWPTLISHEYSLPPKYGQSLAPLFASLMPRDDPSSSKLLELCINSCRAVETLEADAINARFSGETLAGTYFTYVRGVVTAQCAHMYREFTNTNTFAESVSISINLFYLLVLQRTPWRRPLQVLCSHLRRSLSNGESPEDDEDFDEDEGDSDDKEDAKDAENHNGDNEAREEAEDERSKEGFRPVTITAYLWILAVCACAARLSHDQATLEWTEEGLKKVGMRYFKAHSTTWKVELLQDLKGFVWSEMFLSGHLLAVFSEWEICTSVPKPTSSEEDDTGEESE